MNDILRLTVLSAKYIKTIVHSKLLMSAKLNELLSNCAVTKSAMEI